MASFISQFNVVSKLAPIYVSLVLSIVPIHLMVSIHWRIAARDDPIPTCC